MEKILLEEDLKKVKVLLNKYEVLAEKGNIEEVQNLAKEALTLLDISREKFGDDRRIWATIGDIYNYYNPLDDFAENSRKATQAYHKALGDDVCLLKKLSNSYAWLGHELGIRTKNEPLMKAISLSQIYLEIIPGDHEEWANLGSHFSFKDELKEAKKCYQRALEIDPMSYRALTMLATIYRQDCDYEKALQMLRMAAESEPESHHPWRRMAGIQFEIATGVDHSLSAYKPKNLEEAIKLMEKAAKLTPSSWGIRQDLALYYWLRGDLEKAVENQRMSEELKRTN